ncbi:hypothetical protein [Rhodopirellula europaea]|uniref:hypothetical protein n=1 Tax=Rhodopirellula europaea TaxID=1263866 RepID=UPI000684862B|nr:hypothetical protein [Rhodopirellula europaea]
MFRTVSILTIVFVSASAAKADDTNKSSATFAALARMTQAVHTSSLPDVDRIEVCALNGDDKPGADDDVFPVRSNELLVSVHSVIVLTDANCKRIADDWRALKFRPNSTFCHIPAYGLRFYQGDNLVFSVSVCWKCRNFYIPKIDPVTGHAGMLLYGFDDNSASKRLLNDLKRLLPHPSIR